MDDSNSLLLMLADVARLDDRKVGDEERKENPEPSTLDRADHAYVSRSDFDILVNSTHNYYDRINQAEQETDIDHSYAFFLPNNERNLPGTSMWFDEEPVEDSLVYGIPFPSTKWHCQWQGCSEECEEVTDMEKHVDTHLERGARRCLWRDCARGNDSFPSRYILREHIRLHYLHKPFTCEICGKKSRTGQRHRLHKQTVHGQQEGVAHRSYFCKHCCKEFKTTSDRRKHVMGVHEKVKVECQICKELFANNTVLRRHHKRRH